MTHSQIAANGTLGFAASMFSIITTFQEQLEWWVRISGGMLGLIVAGLTIYRLLTRNSKS